MYLTCLKEVSHTQAVKFLVTSTHLQGGRGGGGGGGGGGGVGFRTPTGDHTNLIMAQPCFFFALKAAGNGLDIPVFGFLLHLHQQC